MTRWQVQEAKQRFSELVRQAIDDGPQVVTRRGEDAVVVVSIEQYRRLRRRHAGGDFKAFLASAPDLEVLEIERSDAPAPSVDVVG